MVNKILLALLLLATTAGAYTAPTGSPLANADHPRLGLISASHRTSYPNAPGLTVAEMRTRLTSTEAYVHGGATFKVAFQAFIDAMDAIYGTTPSTKVSGKDLRGPTYDAINFAFLSIMDPSHADWATAGITFTYTAQQYADEAITNADYVAAQMTASPTTWAEEYTFQHSSSYYAGCMSLCLGIVADWLNGNGSMTTAKKEAYVDALEDVYQNRPAWGQFASFKFWGYAQRGAGVIGIYGDTLGAGYSTTMDTLMDDVEANWVDAAETLGNRLYGDGANHTEGTAYDWMAINNAATFLFSLGTALNDDKRLDTTYFADHIYNFAYRIVPEQYDSEWRDLTNDDTGGSSLTEVNMGTPWGTNEAGWFTMLDSLTGNDQGAAQWIKDTYYTANPSTSYQYRGVLFYFLQGGDVTPVTPATAGWALSRDVGMGQYIMRTGFAATTDSLVSFYAPEWHGNHGGHAHKDFGSFKVWKHGQVIDSHQAAKGYSGGEIYATQRGWFNNVISVFKTGETTYSTFNLAGFRENFDTTSMDPTDAAWQTSGVNHVGEVVGSDLQASNYDYVDYDYSDAWDDTKVTYAEREFVYLRSEGGTDDEFVVVFDRVTAANSTYQKYARFHAAVEPVLYDEGDFGTPLTMTADTSGGFSDGGRWTYTADETDVWKVTNTYDTMTATGFFRVLEPTSYRLAKTGGPSHYWEDALGASVETPASLTAQQAIYHGAWTMAAEPSSAATYDTFLSVLQFGNSTTLSSMAVTDRITATGNNGNMVGALVKESTKNRVVLFNETAAGSVDKVTGPISYTITTTAASRHLLTNVVASTAYTVTRAGSQIATPTSTAAGTLTFADASFGAAEYVVTAGAGGGSSSSSATIGAGQTATLGAGATATVQ